MNFCKKIFLLIALGFALYGSSYIFANDKIDAAKIKIFPVTVTNPTFSDIPIHVKSIGSLLARDIVHVSSEVDGRIQEIYFKNGEKAQKDALIIQLDDTQDQANYKTALVAMQIAQTNYDRFKKLLNVAITQEQFDQQRVDLEQKKNAVDNMVNILKEKKILAPIDGTLGDFSINVGDYIKAGQDLVTLVNNKILLVKYNLDENILPKLKLGQKVMVTSSAYANKNFFGQISFISPTIDPATRMVTVQATIPNDNGELSPGMFVDVITEIEILKNALMIPEQSVLADAKGSYVFKNIKNKAALTYITTGEHINGMVQVIKGINAKDQIVVAGIQNLSDGSNIQIAQDKQPKKILHQ